MDGSGEEGAGVAILGEEDEGVDDEGVGVEGRDEADKVEEEEGDVKKGERGEDVEGTTEGSGIIGGFLEPGEELVGGPGVVVIGVVLVGEAGGIVEELLAEVGDGEQFLDDLLALVAGVVIGVGGVEPLAEALAGVVGGGGVEEAVEAVGGEDVEVDFEGGAVGEVMVGGGGEVVPIEVEAGELLVEKGAVDLVVDDCLFELVVAADEDEEEGGGEEDGGADGGPLEIQP